MVWIRKQVQTHRTKNPKIDMETLRRRIFGKPAPLNQDSKTWFVEIRGVKITEEDFDKLQPIIEIPPVVDQLQHEQSEDVKFYIGGCEESPITEEFYEQFDAQFSDDSDATMFSLPTP